MLNEPLIKCIYLNHCHVPCAFKKGVLYDHLKHSIAFIPNSDTERELVHNYGNLHSALRDGGWWIRCKRFMFGPNHVDRIMNGRIHFADTDSFEEGVRYVKAELENV
jgi:hypothetical protein